MTVARLSGCLPVSLRRLGSASLYAVLLLLGSCQTPTRLPLPPQHEGAIPSASSAGAHAERYVIQSGLSDVRILVFKAGPLAALGHNHVLQAKVLTGEIYLDSDLRQSQFSMNIPVADLLVWGSHP